MHDAEVTAEKTKLRAELSKIRSARGPDELARARAAIRTIVLARCVSAGWTCIAGYLPLRSEPGSTELLAALFSRGVRVLVPVTLADRDLDWVQWGPAGLGEPVGPDAIGLAEAVFVPALAVAADGTRLGRGGGSYDRALARCRPGTPLVALIFDAELVATLPRDEWDRPVTAAVTPSGWVQI